MNIGTQTTSLVNHLYNRMTNGSPDPIIGMGATILGWSDRHAGTVQSVTKLDSKVWSYQITVTSDTRTVVSGSEHDGSAVYSFSSNLDGYGYIYRKDRKTGHWVSGYINPDSGRFIKQDGRLILGFRESYIDPSF